MQRQRRLPAGLISRRADTSRGGGFPLIVLSGKDTVQELREQGIRYQVEPGDPALGGFDDFRLEHMNAGGAGVEFRGDGVQTGNGLEVDGAPYHRTAVLDIGCPQACRRPFRDIAVDGVKDRGPIRPVSLGVDTHAWMLTAATDARQVLAQGLSRPDGLRR